jgi:glycosyltransferase involved in cell wall biosynthesis
MKTKNILAVVPDLNLIGGVANHYLGLKKYFRNQIEYIYYGKRSYNLIPVCILFFTDIINYIGKLIFSKIDIVIINPSFRWYQLFRDGIYLLIAKMFKKNVITFIHGWDEKHASKIIKNPWCTVNVYNKSLFIYVLCSSFVKQLKTMGITRPVIITTTKVDDKLLEDFNIQIRNRPIKTILFLARIHKSKGIIETLDAFMVVKLRHQNLTLSIVGSGPMLEYAEKYALKNNIKDVVFYGKLTGNELVKQFISGDIYVLPTYQEGMPTSVLEAMAFGLPVITRPVGGLNDFFKNGKMGYLIDGLDSQDYADKILELIDCPEKYNEISFYNYSYAKIFYASNVAKQIEKDIAKYATE